MSRKNIEIKECPYCGAREFVKGLQMGQGNIKPTESLIKAAFSNGSPVYHILCINCGSIVRSYVKEKDIFQQTPIDNI